MLTEASHRRSTQNYCCKSFRKVYRENANLHACVRVDTCVVTFCKKDCRAGVLLSVWWHFTRSACYENASYWPLPVFTKICNNKLCFFQQCDKDITSTWTVYMEVYKKIHWRLNDAQNSTHVMYSDWKISSSAINVQRKAHFGIIFLDLNVSIKYRTSYILLKR